LHRILWTTWRRCSILNSEFFSKARELTVIERQALSNCREPAFLLTESSCVFRMGHSSLRHETRVQYAARRPLLQSACPTPCISTSRYTDICVTGAGRSNPWSSELTPKRGKSGRLTGRTGCEIAPIDRLSPQVGLRHAGLFFESRNSQSWATEKYDEYTRYAEHCLAVARITRDQQSRVVQREMAAEWLRLAEMAENEHASGSDQPCYRDRAS